MQDRIERVKRLLEKCLLCDGPADFVGRLHTDEGAPFGMPEGEPAMIDYGLCAGHYTNRQAHFGLIIETLMLRGNTDGLTKLGKVRDFFGDDTDGAGEDDEQ